MMISWRMILVEPGQHRYRVYLVNVLQEDDDTIREMIGQASMVILPGNVPASELKSVLTGPGLEGIQQAYDAGAVILAETESAKVFGAIAFATEQDTVTEGFDWVSKAVIVPSQESITESTVARALLSAQEVQVAIGLGVGSALVLGPNAEAETWGEDSFNCTRGKCCKRDLALHRPGQLVYVLRCFCWRLAAQASAIHQIASPISRQRTAYVQKVF